MVRQGNGMKMKYMASILHATLARKISYTQAFVISFWKLKKGILLSNILYHITASSYYLKARHISTYQQDGRL